ncbi:MAG: flagellar motor switch protein FliN [Planctomycetota bacterium]
MEKLLEEVEAEVRRGRSTVLGAGESPPEALGGTSPLELESFAEGDLVGAVGSGGGLGALDDVELDLRIELGRAEMSLEEIVALRDGSVVTLDKLAGDPVDILVNGRLVARGEVLVLNDNFCVRVAEILAPDR